MNRLLIVFIYLFLSNCLPKEEFSNIPSISFDKIEYVKRSLNSLIKAVYNLNQNYPSINVSFQVVDDKSKSVNLSKIISILDKSKCSYDIINHDSSEHKDVIKNQKTQETFSNLSSLLKLPVRAYVPAKGKK